MAVNYVKLTESMLNWSVSQISLMKTFEELGLSTELIDQLRLTIFLASNVNVKDFTIFADLMKNSLENLYNDLAVSDKDIDIITKTLKTDLSRKIIWNAAVYVEVMVNLVKFIQCELLLQNKFINRKFIDF